MQYISGSLIFTIIYFSGDSNVDSDTQSDTQNEHSDLSDAVSLPRSQHSHRSELSAQYEQLSAVNSDTNELRENLASEIGSNF